MKKTLLYTLALLLALGLVAAKKKPIKLFLAGDSTMADKPLNGYPEHGWGMVLPSYFNDNVIIENHARNGRSTRTFISEGRWDFMMSRINKGDFVVIQFGHNDQSIQKVDRYTAPEDYKNNLRKFVTEVRAKSAIPILCTSLERRKFDDKGNFVDQHGNYPNFVREVAKEMDVFLVDMQHSSMDLIISKGVETSKAMFIHLAPGEHEKFPEGKEDNTHFRPAGAMEMARLFIEGIQQLKIEPLVKNLQPTDKIQVTLTIPVEGLKDLKSTINHNLDEGKTK